MGRAEGEDRKAILEVVEEETAAYFRKDYEAWARCWVQADYVRRWMWFRLSGISVLEGRSTHADRMKESMARSPALNPSQADLRRENINLRISNCMAWITFNQYGPKTGDPFDVPGIQHEMRVLEKHAGEWKIAYFCVLQRSLDTVTTPLIRVSADTTVLSMNPAAEERLRGRLGLLVRGDRLRASNKAADERLQAAIRWAANLAEDRGKTLPVVAAYGTLPLVLSGGNGEPATVLWIIAESDMILVSINDPDRVGELLKAAAAIYGITDTQLRLAAHIVAGHDLVRAAKEMKVSVNTVRTHLQRIFDKTGVRSQPALVRVLLSVGPPQL